ncbi:MAG: LysM peptidoglycan-binding domain-containing protein, partial [Bacteroidales bacterium]|nr:LysM peptidoglycan-binding domain-containing protein [Bacteroidales bacterium]
KPATQSSQPSQPSTTSATFSAKDYTLVETYTVKSGDNPYNIAKHYSWATADEILKWNNISDPSKLQIGQKLKIYKKK